MRRKTPKRQPTLSTDSLLKTSSKRLERELSADELEHVTGGQNGNLYVGETISGRRIQK